MEAVCPTCKLGFTYLGGGREPMVLPCGDSICKECVNQHAISHTFLCGKCGMSVTADIPFPLNRLYYELQDNYNNYMKKKEYYDSPSVSKGEDELSRQHIRYDQKCMNPFCMRLRYQADDTTQLFCSNTCRIDNEQLYLD